MYSYPRAWEVKLNEIAPKNMHNCVVAAAAFAKVVFSLACVFAHTRKIQNTAAIIQARKNLKQKRPHNTRIHTRRAEVSISSGHTTIKTSTGHKETTACALLL